MSTSRELRSLLALVLLAGAVAGCSGSAGGDRGGAAKPRDVVQQLRSRGVALRGAASGDPSLLGVRPQVFDAPDGQLQLFRFRSVELARTRAAEIEPGGYGIDRNGNAVQVEWVAPPHWFQTGTSIVVYLGTNARVLEALRSIAGPQFAGA